MGLRKSNVKATGPAWPRTVVEVGVVTTDDWLEVFDIGSVS